KLNEMATKYDSNIESVAVAWLIKLGALPLIGTLEEKRIQNNLEAFAIHQDQQALWLVRRRTSIISVLRANINCRGLWRSLAGVRVVIGGWARRD
ncbi:MAG: hypothetical protein AN484_28910, partial [Aphanizomenon flos-aquae WA102]